MNISINKRIIALDPGGVTGWATYSCHDVLGEQCNHTFHCGQLEGDHHNSLDVLLGNQHVPDYTIVCESFQKYRELDSPELVSLEHIGVVKRFAQEWKVPLVFQSSSQGKIGKRSFVRRSSLVRMGLWSPGNPHAMDAYGHLLYYMINGGGTTPEFRMELLIKGWQ
jgi:hypothetical protein